MSAEEYLKAILINKKAPPISLDDSRLNNIKSILSAWAGQYLSQLKQAGSNAKGTAVRGLADIDIFISLKAETPGTLKEFFNKLDVYVSNSGITTKRQNVSLRIKQAGLDIDLVPGKIQSGYMNYHSIYSSKKDTWMQTNVDLLNEKIKNSRRQEEIILTKIWRENHLLDFPSTYLELTILPALKNKNVGDNPANLWSVLQYLRDDFVNAIVQDPANTNNLISDMLSKNEKLVIASKAEVWEKPHQLKLPNAFNGEEQVILKLRGEKVEGENTVREGKSDTNG
jgi:hypothetical protein